ncbi:collagen triple helix repeat protein [Saudi moumouvirus]|nr:collagen triple helix repeat protein [Saudi moumouvirus]
MTDYNYIYWGPPGIKGEKGNTGTNILTGFGFPFKSLNNGDIYLDICNGILYIGGDTTTNISLKGSTGN